MTALCAALLRKLKLAADRVEAVEPVLAVPIIPKPPELVGVEIRDLATA